MKLGDVILCGLLAWGVLGDGSISGPTADDPCGLSSSSSARWLINTTAQANLMSGCTNLSQHVIWISNNFPGVFSLPKLVTVDSIYIGDVFHQDHTASIADGTLTGISLPALTTMFEFSAVDLGSLESIDMTNLAGDGGFLFTLAGLPNLKNYTFSTNFNAEYVNITNTGLTEFTWPSKTNLYSMTVVGNPSLTKIEFGDGANVTDLVINCGDSSAAQAAGRPMPRLSGPATINDLEVSFCDQPVGDWRTALDGLGTTSVRALAFHDNIFTGLQVSNMTELSGLEIHDNPNLAEIAFPDLNTAYTITLKNNADLAYLNTTTFPNLKNVSGEFSLSGSFNSITMPPNLANAPFISITSDTLYFNCSDFTSYEGYHPPTTSPYITVVSCSDPDTYSPSSGSSSSSSSSSGPHLAPVLIVAIVVPIIGFIFWVIVIWWLCIRRRNRRRKRKAEMKALQDQIQGLAEPIQVLAAGQPINPQPAAAPERKPVPVVAMSQVQNGNLNGNADEADRAVSPLSTMISREEALDAKERALAERERLLEEEALDARERALQAKERELEALEAARRNA